jgi:uncharacterized membrane protein YfcA
MSEVETLILFTTVSFLTSLLAGVIGMGGGIILISVMASFMPPTVLIPIHGVVQMVSNGSRVALHFGSIRWRIAILTLAGASIGVGIASQILVDLPENLFKVILGGFILALTWLPIPKQAPKFPGKFFFLGGASGFLGMFIGATGPMLAPFYLREGFNKVELVVNKAVAQLLTHVLKILAFIGMGFAFEEYWQLLVSMSIAAVLGSMAGKKVLHYFPEKHFKTAFRVVVTVLAGRLIVLALVGGIE